MHQPLYLDPEGGPALLPWARLHGGRAYLDVARLLDEFPEVRLVVNFVPSLVDQLEGVATGATDTWLELARRPAASWSMAERTTLLERFFSVEWSRNIEPRPRYRELLDKRGRAPKQGDIPTRAASFSDGELRDLTVLFHLAWLGFASRELEPHRAILAGLERKGRGYDDDDLAAVIAAGRAACARVLPLWRHLAARGQVELSSSPYYHPILPLVCDSDAARRALPGAALPDRYAWPADARRQISLARLSHESRFGTPRPLGMWPPEGSISPEALVAYQAEGIRWLASDEGNLFRSLDSGARRGDLYRPYRFGGVDLVFRDREISDRIGFSYSHGEPRGCVDDLLGRVRRAGDQARAAGNDAPLVAIILDGENPWEAYPGSGEPFLRTLFAELERERERGTLRCQSIGAYLDGHADRVELPRLHSGSWIDSDFHIWIGDAVKNRAWNLLGRTRRLLERAVQRGADATRVEEARRHVDAAEGSDWFWWFGEPFHSTEDDLFDRLFRAHLAAAWRALGEVPPEELARPVDAQAAPAHVHPPRSFIHPSVDGRVGSYFEWTGAGRVEIGRGAAMAESPMLKQLHFGFDDHTLFMRGDPMAEALPQMRAAWIELEVRSSRDDHTRRFVAAPGGPAFALEDLKPVGRVACNEVLEIALPFETFAAAPGDRLEVVLRLREGGAAGVVVARVPREGALELHVPDEDFDLDHWFL